MGMYDSFKFGKGILPDNKVDADHIFQSKDLDCCLDLYQIDEAGVAAVKEFEDGRCTGWNKTPLNFQAYVYSHVFWYENKKTGKIQEERGWPIEDYKYLGADYQCYKIIVVNNRLVFAEKVSDTNHKDDE